MKSIRFLLLIVVALASLVPSMVLAQATRTWVSGVGDDANPCSRTAPCKTFAGAISKTAVGGVISVLDPGGFGAVTITKSITLDGRDQKGSILASGMNGVVINVTNASDVVVLKNIDIQGAGSGLSGVRVVSAGAVHIEDCTINGFSLNGIEFQGGIPAAQLFVQNTTIRNCMTNGVRVGPTAKASVLIEDSSVLGNGTGINISSNATAEIRNTTIAGNFGAGLMVGSNASVNVSRVTTTDNLHGLQVGGFAMISDSTIANNLDFGIKRVAPGVIQSSGDNRVFGNPKNGAPNTANLLLK